MIHLKRILHSKYFSYTFFVLFLFSPKNAVTAAPSTSFEDQNQSESMNSTENTMFENSMSNSITQVQDTTQVTSPDRTSTPVSMSESNDQNHMNEHRASPTPTSPGREKSPTWEQQQSNTTDNDTVDSEVSYYYYSNILTNYLGNFYISVFSQISCIC